MQREQTPPPQEPGGVGCWEPMKFSGNLGRHTAAHSKPMEKALRYPTVWAPDCPGFGHEPKQGIPHQPDSLCSIPACFGTTTSDCSHNEQNREESERETERLDLCHVSLVAS